MRIVSAASLVLLLAACDSAGTDSGSLTLDPEAFINVRELSQDAAALVGTWEWERSTYFYTASDRPETHTPASTGRDETWTFRTDGTAVFLVDGDTARVTTYEVRLRGEGADIPSLLLDRGYGYEFGTDGDRLVLDASPVDGPQSVYRRR